MIRWGPALTTIALATVLTTVASAQSVEVKPAQKSPSAYDRLWDAVTNWYDDGANPFIQRVVFTGRFQQDFAAVSADQGDHDEANVRRLRFGPRVTLFHDYLVHVEVDLNPQEHDPFYVRLTDGYVAWQKHPNAVITVGKQSIPFTQEGATSSRELLTIDRSNLANNIWFTQEYTPGASLSGHAAPWNYRVGLYSAGAKNREFGTFTGGLFTLGVLGYDFGARLGVHEAVLSANYLYQEPDADNTFTKPFKQVGSLNFRLEQPRGGVRADVSETDGYGSQPDILGIMVMPFYNPVPDLQVVLRLTFLNSSGPNGLTLGTYENRLVKGAGDRYFEDYVGVNYYFYGHRLKLQTGLQFAKMRDDAHDGGAYAGLSWTTGLRVGW